MLDFIRNDKNLGYGYANNVALRQVKTEFSLILNPDAFLFEEDIEISLNILKENSQIALASPKIFRDDNH
ncbi:MAG: GT2 family glycosyltransferase [Rickettsiales bacterium]|jgi:GT2 family glycosyltransferase